MKILMVCLGNICRSPLAEGILTQKIKNNKLENIVVDSAGTSDNHINQAPDARTQENALTHQVDLSQLKARQFTVKDFDKFDAIYVMDSSNYNNVIQLARSITDKNKVKFLLNETFPNANKAVPDPYFGGKSGFEDVFQLVNNACEIIVEKLKK